MKRSRQADPLEPERHQCARVEVSSNHSRDRGIHHEHYDLRFGLGKASFSSALG